MISIITITKNNLSGLIKTLKSVESSSSKFITEIVIVDSLSNDGSKEYINEKKNENRLEINHIYESDNGVYHAMNKGVRSAKGEYVIFINSGDSLIGNFPDNLPGNKYSAGIAFSCFYNFKKIKVKVESRKTNLNRIRLPGLHQGMLYKKSVLMKFPFSNEYKICGDLEQYVRMTKTNPSLGFDISSIIIAELDSGGISSEKPLMLFKESIRVIFQNSSKYKYYSAFRVLTSLIIYQLIYRIDKIIAKIH